MGLVAFHSAVCFTFRSDVPFDEVEGTLELSRLAAGILHGHERVVLEAPSQVLHASRTIRIATHTRVGRTLSLMFLGFARGEFGDMAVTARTSSMVATVEKAQVAL
jgi:hypothetical protein